MNVLVVTLFSGENEFEACKFSVKTQVGLNIEHRIIESLPKQQAHQMLYKMFNDSRGDFDYLAKLDADMAFATPNSLKSIIDRFDDGVDVVSATVHDGITDSDMQSFNVFSNRCYFHYGSNDPLFTDRLQIDYPGSHCSYVDLERNVKHAFNPWPFQAFMFGVHRALKVVQSGVMVPTLNNSYHQHNILNKTYENWIKNGSKHAEYAVWGATLVYSRRIDSVSLFQKSDYQSYFDEIVEIGGVKADDRLRRSGLMQVGRVLGPTRFLKALIAQLFRKFSA